MIPLLSICFTTFYSSANEIYTHWLHIVLTPWLRKHHSLSYFFRAKPMYYNHILLQLVNEICFKLNIFSMHMIVQNTNENRASMLFIIGVMVMGYFCCSSRSFYQCHLWSSFCENIGAAIGPLAEFRVDRFCETSYQSQSWCGIWIY